ncbi:MAG: fasciclin domain-containing protein, partial [Gammaproteobacteria bacterium]
MNTQTLTYRTALPLMLTLLLLAFTSVSIAGDKARSKLPTITDIAETTDGFGILYAALEAAGLDGKFDGKRHFTVFAPTDEAFARLLEVNGLTPDDLLGSGDLLVSVLKYHVTRGDRQSGSVLAAGALKMLDRNNAATSVSDDGAMIDDAVITGVDIKASNGIVHVIDTVLLPPGAPLISAP